MVQTFVTAYNRTDEERLAGLAPPDSAPIAGNNGVPIADLSGILHLGEEDTGSESMTGRSEGGCQRPVPVEPSS